MFFNAVDAIQMALFVLYDAPHIAEEVIAAVSREDLFAIFRREYDVVTKLCVRCHRSLCAAGLCPRRFIFDPCGVVLWCVQFRGFAPTATHV